MCIRDRQYSSRDIMIFKPYRRSDDGSYLTVSEMVGPPVRGLLAKNAFDARGIEVIENSPDDIRATVVEMMDKCDGRSDYSAEDDDLQQRFKALADPFDVADRGGARHPAPGRTGDLQEGTQGVPREVRSRMKPSVPNSELF